MRTEQLTLDLGMPTRTWGMVRPGEVVPQPQSRYRTDAEVSGQ